MKCYGESLRIIDDGIDNLGGKCLWRIDGDGISRMDARTFYVFHNTRDDNIDTVGDAINFDLSSFHIAIDEYRMVWRHFDGTAHVVAQFCFVIDNLHRTAAEDIGRTNHDRIADISSPVNRILEIGDTDTAWTWDVRLREYLVKAFAILCAVDIVD